MYLLEAICPPRPLAKFLERGLSVFCQKVPVGMQMVDVSGESADVSRCNQQPVNAVIDGLPQLPTKNSGKMLHAGI